MSKWGNPIEFKGLQKCQSKLNSRKIIPYVDELHWIEGNCAGVSAQGTGWPSKPLKGTLPSACDIRCIVPSASPNAIYAALGESAAQVK